MAPTDNLPRIRKHEDHSKVPSADSGRYGSSRDHYVGHAGSPTLSSVTDTFYPKSSRDERRGDRDRENFRGSDRRRSRSPHRRRREPEVDSYSSSRDYRAREREDRYGGRDAPREDRGWDRDRGRGDRDDRGMTRRDARRDDYDRPPRRDRDLFEGRMDRGMGGRDNRGPPPRVDRTDRGDRDEFAQQLRKKSASPPPKKKEPTPDLTDTVPINERKRRLTQWDIKPPGYENVTAEQAKLSGKSYLYDTCCPYLMMHQACSLCQALLVSNLWTQVDYKPL